MTAPRRARLPRLAAGASPSSRRSSARCCLRAKPARRCTSSTSARAAAWRWPPRRGRRGVDVSIETCPHYLFFTEEDIERLGRRRQVRAAAARRATSSEALWDELLARARRHRRLRSLAGRAGDEERRLRRGWGGIAGVQSTLPVLLDRGYHERGLPLERIASLLAGEPARALPDRAQGHARAGYDADLVLVDLDAIVHAAARPICSSGTRSARTSAQTFRGAVRRTMRRGETIFADGRIAARDGGRFVRPGRIRTDLMTERHSELTRAAPISPITCSRRRTPSSARRCPACGNATAIVHTSPAAAPRSCSTPPNSSAAARSAACGDQRFVYVLEGAIGDRRRRRSSAGGLRLPAAGARTPRSRATAAARAAVIEKPYEPLHGTHAPAC